MTPQQLATLKAYILADPILGPKTSGEGTDYGFIADAMSAPKSPTVLAWRTNVQPNDADDAPDYSVFDALTQGKRDSWGFFLRTQRDFTRQKTRKWITDVWGAATAASNSEAILLAGTEAATVAEVAVGGPTRVQGTVSAMARNYSGGVTIEDLGKMFNAQKLAG